MCRALFKLSEIFSWLVESGLGERVSNRPFWNLGPPTPDGACVERGRSQELKLPLSEETGHSGLFSAQVATCVSHGGKEDFPYFLTNTPSL